MRIAITGSTGLVGSTLIPFLKTAGCTITRVVRNQTVAEDVVWNPEAGRIDASQLEDHDAVVHLAGENIAARRWTTEQKSRIRDSRVQRQPFMRSYKELLKGPVFQCYFRDT